MPVATAADAFWQLFTACLMVFNVLLLCEYIFSG